MRWLSRNGYDVFLLIINTESIKKQTKIYGRDYDLHIDFYSPDSSGVLSYLSHIRYLRNYTKKHSIDFILSHLQLCNLIGTISQYFIKAKLIPTRHHIDVTRLVGNKKSLFIDKVINKLAKCIVVLSDTAKNDLVENENVNSSKIKVIPLGYDYDISEKPNESKVSAIRQKYKCDVLLITVSRMEKTKNHKESILCLKRLLDLNVDAKLIFTNRIEDSIEIYDFIKSLELESQVCFVGYRKDIVNYLATADFLLHPSVSESSNQVVREASMGGTPSLLVQGVGDFDEYIINLENAFVVDRKNIAKNMAEVILRYKDQKILLKKMSNKLREDSEVRFNINQSMQLYSSVMKQALLI